jgi:hypothetical protein
VQKSRDVEQHSDGLSDCTAGRGRSVIYCRYRTETCPVRTKIDAQMCLAGDVIVE